jgi:AcrR family transcriptional regulator
MPAKEKLQAFKRDLVLEGAGALFIEVGYDAMKVADLAKNVGLSVGTIYNLFGSKEQLYQAYILKIAEDAITRVETTICDLETPEAKLREMTRVKFELIIRHKMMMRESVSDPTFFFHLSAGETNPILHFQRYVAKTIMTPLATEADCTIDPMELVFLYDGLGIAAIKHAMACGGDLMEQVDTTIDRFLLLVRG